MDTNISSPYFYIGKQFDPAQNTLLDQKVLYDPADLTTHAVVTGMTGSGKTGLCISMLEEAALKGIPAIIIDIKGDLTNLLLHFPDLAPRDFQPWLDPDAYRGKDMAVVAQDTAASWSKGLASWGLGRPELLRLQSEVHFSIYTPGSSAGLPVNILSSFNAPGIPWEENKEVLLEEIGSTVTALLGLVGISDIDPLRSREHILLSNLLQNAWSKGNRLELTDLILQVQNPPIERLGAFPVDTFYPQKDRLELSMLLNNFLASPSFQSWMEGESLDIPSLLYSSDGKPRHSIFYVAHLDDNERMFFITLLLSTVEAWMRTQRGTGSLRALIYIDEVLGYLPPVANPPSRPVILRMLKQARAFGVGLLLATQNPVDLDYKALSNTGTWFIGRLQTDQDKQRLLDGLTSAAGAVDRSEIDRMISGLGKRVFLLHNVRSNKPQLFQTRWALNFLAGPLTRTQIPELNKLVSAEKPAPSTGAAKPAATAQGSATSQGVTASAAVSAPQTSQRTSDSKYSSTSPALPAGVNEFFVNAKLSAAEAASARKITFSQQTTRIVYLPALLAQAEVRYLATRYSLDYTRNLAIMLQELENSSVDWSQCESLPFDREDLQSEPISAGRFAPLSDWLSDPRKIKTLQTDFTAWVVREGTIQVRANEKLKVYASPEVTSAEFRTLCSEAARKLADQEADKLKPALEKKLDALQQKIERQKLEVKQNEKEASQRRIEEVGSGGELLFSLFGGRKKSLSSTLSKHRMAEQSAEDLKQSEKELADLQEQAKELEKDSQEELAKIQERWAEVVNDENSVPLAPAKKDVYLKYFGVAWLPHYLIGSNEQAILIPAFPTEK